MRVFVNGTFDILHPAHVRMLEKAKSYGSHLLVALDTDERVKSFKGPERPINDLEARMFMMKSLRAVDDVSFFGSDEELINIIEGYKPDYMMVGSDYRDKKVIGSEHAKKLLFYEREPCFSTTKVIEKIQNGNTLRITDM